LIDVAAVGRSGRHLTTFEMMAHHCFNRPNEGEVVYWIDECITFCDRLLTEAMGIDATQITYVENPWSGGGNAGPAVEVIVGGLELATLVFMNLEEREDGTVVIKGVHYGEMPLQIIDTGYGLERFCWAAAGTSNIYDAIYPNSVRRLKKLAGFDTMIAEIGLDDVDSLLAELSRLSGILNIDVGVDVNALYEKLVARLEESGISIDIDTLVKVTEPLSTIFAIPDHMHALCHMLGDSLVPSNSKAGYLARMMARRVCRMKDDLGLTSSLADLAAFHMDEELEMSGFRQTREGILTILELEEQRYQSMLVRGEAAVNTALRGLPKDAEHVPDEILFKMAEERGLQPEMVVGIAKQLGWQQLIVKVGFAAEMAERNAAATRALAKATGKSGILTETHDFAETVRSEYDDEYRNIIEAEIIACIELDSRSIANLNLSSEVNGRPTHAVILDRSIFYPESGGQLGDQGELVVREVSVKVLDTKIENGVVLHLTNAPLPIGQVTLKLDTKRRLQLMDHHTSVHIIGGSAREILGPHIWQAGSAKGVRYARLDITHHSRLSEEEINTIEAHANSIVAQNMPIEKQVLDRAEADAQYGFDIYQGGPPKHDRIRVVKIGEHDVQACAGTHHSDTAAVTRIRLIRANQVQDGVERLHILAGQAAADHAKQQEELLNQAAEILGVQVDELPNSVQRFFDEWREQRRRIEHLEAEIVRLRTTGGGDDSSIEKDGVRYVIMELDGDLKQMQNMVAELTRDESKPTVAILGSREGGGKILVAITENSTAAKSHDAGQILRAIIPHIDGGGGGRPTFAQGGGSNPDGLDEALAAARTHLNL
jgi:alanyl-tRNA synthetase